MTETESRLIHYQALMKNALDAINIVDELGNVVEANDSFCNLMGYTHEEALQLNLADWNAQWSKDELRARLKNFANKSARFETVHRRKDGTLLNVEVSTAGVEIEGKVLFFTSTRDITERKRAEASLKNMATNLNVA
jgi:PAS domain S-box-containing protein